MIRFCDLLQKSCGTWTLNARDRQRPWSNNQTPSIDRRNLLNAESAKLIICIIFVYILMLLSHCDFFLFYNSLCISTIFANTFSTTYAIQHIRHHKDFKLKVGVKTVMNFVLNWQQQHHVVKTIILQYISWLEKMNNKILPCQLWVVAIFWNYWQHCTV